MKPVMYLMWLCLLLIYTPIFSQQFPKKDINQYVWDLSLLYPSQRAWDDELIKVNQKIREIGKVKEYIGKSAKDLAKAMDEIYDLRSCAAKLSIYGGLQSDVNIKDDKAASMSEVGSSLEREVESSISFLSSEIKLIGKEKIEKWLKEEPSLQRHKRRLNRIVAEIPYTASSEQQAIIQSMDGWPAISGDGYYSFFESDWNWPKSKNLNGAEIEITNLNYKRLRRSPFSEERIGITKSFLGFLDGYTTHLGYLYVKRIEADLVIAKHRNFSDGIDALWYLRDGAPIGSYKEMTKVARANKSLLNRYASSIKRMSGLNNVSYEDFFFVPKAFSKTIEIDEAWEIVLKALAPLGSDYISLAKKELAKPYMHLIPSANKRGFYANQSPIAGIPSFTMMTFTGSYADLRTLVGIAVSKVEAVSIPQGNFPDTRDDPPIYGNGMLYVAEMLLDDYLISNSSSKEEKVFHMNNALSRLWNHCFTEVINTELDASIQQMIINHNPPGGNQVSDEYLKLLKSYYGDIKVDDIFKSDWMMNPVQFRSYENQFWPAAMAAACLVHQKIKSGDSNGIRAAFGLIGKGETDLSYGMLKSIGVDLNNPITYQAMYTRMDALLDELEKTLK